MVVPSQYIYVIKGHPRTQVRVAEIIKIVDNDPVLSLTG